MTITAIRTAAIAAVALFGAAGASAATFVAENGFGVPPSFGACKTASVTTPFATGSIITTPDYTGVCVGWFGVDIDTAAKTITLTGLDYGNYEYGYLSITGITGTSIASLSTVQYTPLFDPTYYGGAFGTVVPVPQLSFTANSISIVFNAVGVGDGQFTYNGAGGQAIFSYGVVPEPATWALLIAGFGMTGYAMRRRTLQTAKA